MTVRKNYWNCVRLSRRSSQPVTAGFLSVPAPAVLREDMKDGILYSNILLKLYLKSLKNGGKLQLDEHIPYTAQMIATLTRHQIGTVERALEIFRQLGLVEQLDSGAFYMTDIELMIGQSSTEAERDRKSVV